MNDLINFLDGWTQAEGYTAGTMIKVLRDDNYGKTFILKVPQGFHMDAHSHDFVEQHFVLRGEYLNNGNVYPEGTFRIFNPGVEHGPFDTHTDTLILVVWDVFNK